MKGRSHYPHFTEVGTEASEGRCLHSHASSEGHVKGAACLPCGRPWGRGCVSSVVGGPQRLAEGTWLCPPWSLPLRNQQGEPSGSEAWGWGGCWAGLCPSIREAGSRGGRRRKPSSMQMRPQHLLVLRAPGGGQSASGRLDLGG